MKYYPYGPLEVPLTRRRIEYRNKNPLVLFWEQFDELLPGISDAVGCYIFSIRAGKGIRPWYVGMAEKQSFKKECFAPHKRLNYNDCLSERKGTPVLTLLPKLTSSGRFARRSINGHRDISILENMLISACLQRNSDLLNIKSTKMLRELEVPGLINSPRGRNNQTVVEFQKLIGTKRG